MGIQENGLGENTTYRKKGKRRRMVWRLMCRDKAKGSFVFSMVWNAVGNVFSLLEVQDWGARGERMV